MELISSNYNSDSDESDNKAVKYKRLEGQDTLSVAPAVAVPVESRTGDAPAFIQGTQGPTGLHEVTNFNDSVFESHRLDFISGQGASDPYGSGKHVVKALPSKEKKAPDVEEKVGVSQEGKNRKRKRTGNQDGLAIDYQGPWAAFEGQENLKEEAGLPIEQRRLLALDRGYILPEDQEENDKKEEDKDNDEVGEISVEKQREQAAAAFEKCDLYVKEQRDYQGRAWFEPPRDAKPRSDDARCWLPKKCVFTWERAHPKAVSAIRLFPKTGHIMLSAGLDGSIKIWDVKSHQPLALYSGHTKGVRDLCFSNDGKQFVSSGYDRQTRLWDTETGKVLNRFSTGKIPFCCKFNPTDEYQHEILVGQNDKKIIQWDTRTGEKLQEYDQHLASVNTITFLSDENYFISSSDDKTLRVWEYGIPVVTKYMADPAMHSMPSIKVTPDKKYFLAQSMDNKVLVYRAHGRIGLHRKKRFMGHTIAGYACQVNMSPDGRYVISGDQRGWLYLWDWKTSKILNVLKHNAHKKVLIGCEWHPTIPSRVITCSWDGSIKAWD